MQLPESERLATGLAEGLSTLGLDLPAPQQALLLAYLALIGKWNRVYNLTAVRDPAEMLRLHLLDSLTVVAPLRRHIGDRPARLMDVGSGAGLPGVVLAIVQPGWKVTCVDTVGKKASFIQQVGAELKLPNLTSAHARVEDLDAPPVDVVVSRAFASLGDFTRLTERHLSSTGVWAAMKGKPAADEQAALPPTVNVFHVEPLVVPGLDAERCVVWMRPKS